MGKKVYDMSEITPIPESGIPLGDCDVFVAENGVMVIVNSARDTMTVVKGRNMMKRMFVKAVSKQWLTRRINDFGEYTKAFKMPRGPRKKTDQEVIAAPIKRIRMKKKAA